MTHDKSLIEAENSKDKYKPHECSCGETHTARQVVAKNFDKQKIQMLLRATDYVNRGIVKHQFKKDDLNLSDFGGSAYGNFPALARYGVIVMAQDKETKQRIRGRWLITPLGWGFVNGKKPVKSWVAVKDKHVRHEFGHGEPMLIKELWDEAELIQTDFEYISSAGEKMMRPYTEPVVDEDGQTKLIDVPTQRRHIDMG